MQWFVVALKTFISQVSTKITSVYKLRKTSKSELANAFKYPLLLQSWQPFCIHQLHSVLPLLTPLGNLHSSGNSGRCKQWYATTLTTSVKYLHVPTETSRTKHFGQDGQIHVYASPYHISSSIINTLLLFKPDSWLLLDCRKCQKRHRERNLILAT